ncbi:MAG: HupE/UreJ family protein [Reyranella sp.]|uniref:HupE/UreJ family protein n=1 Tax=Reyranella sp. TaxID=1929291 RepID=UPI003D133595
MTRLAGAWLVLVLSFSSASAHVTSTGIATLDVDASTLRYRLAVIASEVDYHGGRLLAEAAAGDRGAVDRVTGFARDYARFSIDGEACQPGAVAIRTAGAADKVALEMTLACPRSIGVLAIRDEWPDLMGAHFQTVLSVRIPGRRSFELVFLEARRTATLDLTAPVNTGWVSFIAMGAEHIVGGIDHLLFLVALLALSRGFWPTVTIVTAFTVAHSVTLSLAVLGLVDVPSRIVEPLIAASIVWVALENVLAPSGAGRRWLVAALFGLVHGLGFASALSELGLPPAAMVRALIGFNVGVELGQLAFIVVVLPPLAWASRPERLPRLPKILSIVVALVGAVWFVERIVAA